MSSKKQIFTITVSILLSVALVAVVVNASTSIGIDISVGGDLDIVGTDLQATTGAINISKLGSLTTIKGAFNVDEAATLDSTLSVTGVTTLATTTTTKLTVSNLTSGRIPIISTNGLISDDGDLLFSGDTLTVTNITVSSNLEVGGNATTTGNLVVSGTSTLATTTVSNLTVSGTSTLATTTLSGDLDLNLKQLKNVVLENLADFPSSPVEGQMFWSTATATPYWYTGSQWKGDVSGATFVVATSDSKNKWKADYVADGTADEVEIQAAIDALPSGGGKVTLLEGTYTTTNRIILDSNQTLEGMGYATHIYNTGTTYSAVRVIGVAATHKEKVVVSNLRITGVAGSSNGIYFYYCDYCRAVDNWIEDIGNEGILFSSSTHSIARGNKISGGDKDTDGVKLVNTKYSIISGNNIKDMGSGGTCPCTSDGIELEHSAYNTITSNVIEGGNEYGISLESASIYNSITSNIIRNTASTGILITGGIDNLVSGNMVFDSSSNGIVNYTNCHGTVISGNLIENSDGYGIWVTGANYTAVTGNIVKGDSDSGHGIVLASGASYGVVSGNVVEGMAGAGSNCIYLAGGSSENVVTGNVVRDCSLYEFLMTDDSDNNVIIGNNFFGQGSNFGTATGNMEKANLGYSPALVIDAVDDVIEARGEVVRLNPNGDYTLTSAPTIADGVEQGDTLTLIAANNEPNTVTIQDQGTLASSNLQLATSTRVIAAGKVLVLIWDGTDWIEVSYADN